MNIVITRVGVKKDHNSELLKDLTEVCKKHCNSFNFEYTHNLVEGSLESHKSELPFDSYKEAELVDEIINNLLRRYPLTPENAMLWLTYLRTINTTIRILEEAVHGKLYDTIQGIPKPK